MKPRSAGLSKFVEQDAARAETPMDRKRGKGERVGITIRLNQAQWRAIHEAALSEGVPMTELFIQALSERLQAKGLPPL
jgi:hypothetical protein